MSIRPATDADHDVLRDLWTAFEGELESPDWWDATWEEEWRELHAAIAGDALVLIAESDGRAIGYAFARQRRRRTAHLNDIYVEPGLRGRGVAKALLARIASDLRSRGVEVLTLGVDLKNTIARDVYRRLGFREDSLRLVADLAALEQRVTDTGGGRDSYASTHVQTDDAEAVERALRQFLPRFGLTADPEVTSEPNGWVTVTDDVFDRDRTTQRRLGAELSERLGVPVVALALEEDTVVRFLLFDRGRMVDEYLSVPAYYGELSKTDELALAANPTLVARLTGADPARVRAVARTASSPADLPPARELLAEIAAAMNLVARIER